MVAVKRGLVEELLEASCFRTEGPEGEGEVGVELVKMVVV